jgi:hypothetical protein
MQSSLPVADRPRRPEWMKVRAPSADGHYYDVRAAASAAIAEVFELVFEPAEQPAAELAARA